jgi:RasGEF N-terminal motif
VPRRFITPSKPWQTFLGISSIDTVRKRSNWSLMVPSKLGLYLLLWNISWSTLCVRIHPCVSSRYLIFIFFAAGASQQELFRRAFLVTFRTFATATEVFDLLVAQYELDVPSSLSEEEFEHWRREKLRPTQKRVLTVLTMWLEEYDLLNQDAEVAPKLQEFLSLILSPATLALTAKHMLKSLERLVSRNDFVVSLIFQLPSRRLPNHQHLMRLSYPPKKGRRRGKETSSSWFARILWSWPNTFPCSNLIYIVRFVPRSAFSGQ